MSVDDEMTKSLLKLIEFEEKILGIVMKEKFAKARNS